MARDDLISAYLADVSASLHRETRTIGRIEAEIEDHLRESAGRHEMAGMPPAEAQQRAVAAFGDPEQLALAFRNAQQGAGAMGPFIRFAGAVGLVAPAVLISGIMWWSWYLYAASMLALILSIVGMIAAQPRDARWTAAGCLALAPIGLLVATAAEPVGKIMVFGGFFGCAVALLAGRVLPRPAVLLMASTVAMYGAGVATGVAELPMWLQAVGAVLFSAGWMWSSWTLWRTGSERSAVPPEPAAA